MDTFEVEGLIEAECGLYNLMFSVELLDYEYPAATEFLIQAHVIPDCAASVVSATQALTSVFQDAPLNSQ